MIARSRLPIVCAWIVLALSASRDAHALVARSHASSLGSLAKADPADGLGTIAQTPGAMLDAPGTELWSAFRIETDVPWEVFLDRRSGAPLLVSGGSKGWLAPGPVGDVGTVLADLEQRIRRYLALHEALFHIDEKELVLNRAASGPLDGSHWLVEFERRKGGVRVEGEHVLFYFSAGSLVAFGADRWGVLGTTPVPRIDSDGARNALDSYTRDVAQKASEIAPPELVFTAEPPSPSADRSYGGPVGAGVVYRLAWRIARRFEGEAGTWVAKVDARTGEVLAFHDETQYAQVKGGVYPLSDDQICPDGCEQAGWPMPFADLTTGSGSQTASTLGQFACAPSGGPATTTLAGPYVRVSDVCGAVSETVTCDNDLDLGGSAGTDCDVPPGGSPGNTHAARTGFYHLNRVMEKGRAWLPTNGWLQSQLVDHVNIDDICNAYWDNVSVNFFKSGGGCRNTGEIAGVFVHEWGHGLDFNDGGGYDNPSEAYADIVAMLETHQSCVGRGFFESQVCGGYGDSCLTCTGIRDHDFAQHVSAQPVTPAGYVASHCPAGSGPCGKEVHCEGYVAGEALFDLATRDLPAQGSDVPTAWQTAERLFYTSRPGSGGNAYNCALPSSDGCAASSWFTKFRVQDDDDGSLANGTPHAAAIYAAFARHGIACGAASDASNQNSSSCPSLAAPTLGVTAVAGTATLSWTPVAGAADYRVLRNDAGCNAGHTIIATVASASYIDTGLADGFEEHYAVQARGANPACLSALSNCVAIAPQPTAGVIRLDRSVYNCGSTIQITVTDSNVGATTLAALVSSGAEPTPETILLAETPAGSARFVGTILATTSAASAGDGRLSVANGTIVTARYTDANDGQGGTNVLRQKTAAVDCAPPHIAGVTVSSLTDTSAIVQWTTDEAGDSRVSWGPTRPPQTATVLTARVTSHEVTLSGLTPCSNYYFSVGTEDAAGNLAIDDAGGAYRLFQTPPSGGTACHLGVVQLDRGLYGCGDFMTLTLADIDLDHDPGATDTATVTVTSTSETTPEVVQMQETELSSGIFFGILSTGPLPVVHGDGMLEVQDQDVITVVYHDASNGLGSAALTTAMSHVDCAAPLISGIVVTPLSDDSAMIEWTTSEEAYGYVEFGPTQALGRVEYETPSGPTTHAAFVYPLFECERTYFRIVATDMYGSTATADTPFHFHGWTLPGAVYKQDFEAAHGFTLEGDWQVAAPQGLGGDWPDPPAAEHGAKVLGVDLTGLGANPGDYEPGEPTRYATSPVIDTSHLRNSTIRFRMWLNADPGAVAKVQIYDDSWIDVFTSGPWGWYDSDWETVQYDISDHADGNDNLRIRFSQSGGAVDTMPESGWNIDRLEVRDGSVTNPAACGGCTGVPSFAGLASAQDVDGCAQSGIALSWDSAPGWGTGSAGSYSVYRSTSPTFAPSAANRIATGVTDLTYLDLTAPVSTTLYYVVRAESNETCSTGPHNGGVTDANLLRGSARDDIAQPLPGSVGSTVRLAVINGANVRVSWGSAPNAAAYDVLRASTPAGPYAVVGNSTAPFLDDLNRATVGSADYYLVKAVDRCGNEGP